MNIELLKTPLLFPWQLKHLLKLFGNRNHLKLTQLKMCRMFVGSCRWWWLHTVEHNNVLSVHQCIWAILQYNTISLASIPHLPGTESWNSCAYITTGNVQHQAAKCTALYNETDVLLSCQPAFMRCCHGNQSFVYCCHGDSNSSNTVPQKVFLVAQSSHSRSHQSSCSHQPHCHSPPPQPEGK